MAVKTIHLPEIGPVNLYKRRGTRNLRLSINADGQVRVSLPSWAPYSAAISFIQTKQEWIKNKRLISATGITHNARIGKAHSVIFESNSLAKTVKTRIVGNKIKILHPMFMATQEEPIQMAARQACYRALRQQAKLLLPPRLSELAKLHNFSFNQVTIKRLRSRWGSCDSKGNISLNLFLMQLPWPLIDYVLIHELVHTQLMQHGGKFWQACESCLPNTKSLRREIKQCRAALSAITTNP
jgi:predicted metal-dependent hydrolase